MANEKKVEPTHAAIPVEQFNNLIGFINQSVPTGMGKMMLDWLGSAVPILVNGSETDQMPAEPPPTIEDKVDRHEAARTVMARASASPPAGPVMNGDAAASNRAGRRAEKRAH